MCAADDVPTLFAGITGIWNAIVAVAFEALDGFVGEVGVVEFWSGVALPLPPPPHAASASESVAKDASVRTPRIMEECPSEESKKNRKIGRRERQIPAYSKGPKPRVSFLREGTG
jgi:hypothetical protein